MYKTYDIVVASDNNYIGQVSVLLASILDNLADDEQITLHLLCNSVEPQNIDYLHRQTNGKGSLLTYDTSDIASRLDIEVPHTIAITAYARLLLNRILPSTVNTVLYLDCDIVVNDSLSQLFSTDLSQWAMAGVLDTLPDTVAKVNVGLASDEPYINSGMLLINLERWRRDDMAAQFLDFLLAHNGTVHHHDQGIINGVLRGQILILGPEYNLTSNYYSHTYEYVAKRNRPFYTREQVEQATRQPIITHYTEGFLDRPWVVSSKHPMRQVYLRYRSQSMLSNEPLQPSRKSWYVKLLGWEFMHLPIAFYNATSWTLGLLSKLNKKQ